MKRIFIKYIKWVCSIFPVKNVILFESVPDLEGNSRAVFDEMVNQGFHCKYKLVWLVDNRAQFKGKIKNIYFDNKPTSLVKKILYSIKYFNVKVKITENACYPKFHNNTLAIHLGHGTAIKNTGSFMHINGAADYVLYQSEVVKEITARLHNLNERNLICLGYPRNDNLIKGNNEHTEENYIVWLPTFRKSYLSNRIDSEYIFPLGIPIFKDLEEIRQLNDVLKQGNTKLYIKPHFGAQLDSWSALDFSHIKLIKEDHYKKHGVSLYEFLGKSKALITDYSSVYFDYLLLDKPIGITLDDLEEYQKGIGFVFDDFKKNIKGEYIYTYNDLETYIVHCIQNKVNTNYLRELKLKYNQYCDDQSSKRVVSFIKNKVGM